MKLTVLGCYGPYAPYGHNTSGYLLQTDKTNVLIDCGSGTVSALQKFILPESLDAVILSHHHFDHVADVGVLAQYIESAKLRGKTDKSLKLYQV